MRIAIDHVRQWAEDGLSESFDVGERFAEPIASALKRSYRAGLEHAAGAVDLLGAGRPLSASVLTRTLLETSVGLAWAAAPDTDEQQTQRLLRLLARHPLSVAAELRRQMARLERSLGDPDRTGPDATAVYAGVRRARQAFRLLDPSEIALLDRANGLTGAPPTRRICQALDLGELAGEDSDGSSGLREGGHDAHYATYGRLSSIAHLSSVPSDSAGIEEAIARYLYLLVFAAHRLIGDHESQRWADCRYRSVIDPLAARLDR